MKAGQRFFDRLTNDAMRPLGITGAQAEALSVIRQAGPLSLKDLGDLLIAETGHPSRLIARLVELELVDRTTASDDGRRIVLELTAKGRRLERRAAKKRAEILAAGRDLLGGVDIEDLLPAMRELVGVTPFAGLLERRRVLDAQARLDERG